MKGRGKKNQTKKASRQEEMSLQQAKQVENDIGNALKIPMSNYNLAYDIEYNEQVKEFKIYVYIGDPENINKSQAISAQKEGIKSQVRKAINKIKYTINYSLDFKKECENIFKIQVSKEALDTIVNKLLLLSPDINQKEFLTVWSKQPYGEKLKIIRVRLNSFLNTSLKNHFPEFCKEKNLLSKPFFIECAQSCININDKYVAQMTAIVVNLENSISQYVPIVKVEGTITAEVIFNFEHFSRLVLEGNHSLLKKARRLLAARTLLEDSNDENISLFSKMEKGLNQCKAVLYTYESMAAIFSDCSNQEDILRVLGSNLLFNGFAIDDIYKLVICYDLNIKNLQINRASFTEGANYMEEALSLINIQIASEDKRIGEDEVVENEHVNETPMRDDNEDNIKNTSEENNNETKNINRKTEKIVPENAPEASVKENSTITYPCTLFSSHNLANEYKKAAFAQIKKDEDKSNARKNRNKDDQNLVLLENKNQSEQGSDKFIISISCGEEKRETEMFSLGEKTMHLYLCCDMNFVKSANGAQLEAFQKTAEQCKILKRNALGSNGIKIYGSDFLVIKCKSNGSKNKEHLICFPHTIPGTQNIVFLPAEIISHKVYEDYIHDRALLKKHASICKQSVTISEVPVNKEVNENILNRKFFHK